MMNIICNRYYILKCNIYKNYQYGFIVCIYVYTPMGEYSNTDTLTINHNNLIFTIKYLQILFTSIN